MAHRTATNRRRMHYLIGGTGAFQFLISNLDYNAERSVSIRYDTGMTRIHTQNRGREKGSEWQPADQPQIPPPVVVACHKSCRSCTTGQEREVSHTDAVLPFASVIGRACESSFSMISNPITRHANIYGRAKLT